MGAIVNHLLLYQHREGPAIVLITLYFILFLPFASAYIRVLGTIYTNPGFVPKGPDALQGIANEKIGGNDSDPEMGLGSVHREGRLGSFGDTVTPRSGTATGAVGPRDPPPREGAAGDSMQPQDLDLALPSSDLPHPGRRVSATPMSNTLLPPVIHQHRAPSTSTLQGHSYELYEAEPPPERPEPENLSEWYNREVFVCEPDGKPRWCWHCNCYKPDRSHHCSEVQRCVYKMDHFCPW